MPPLAILHQNVTQELNQGLFSECLGKKQWLDAGQLTWAVCGPATAYAFLQATASASRGCSSVLCQLRITGPLVGHCGGKFRVVGNAQYPSSRQPPAPVPCTAEQAGRPEGEHQEMFLIHRCDNSYCLLATVD